MRCLLRQRLGESQRCLVMLETSWLRKGCAFYPVMHTFAKLLLSLPPIPSFALLLIFFYLNGRRGGTNLVFAVIHAHNLPPQTARRRQPDDSDLVGSMERYLKRSHARSLILPKHQALPQCFAFYYVVHTLSGFGEATISSLHVPDRKGV